MKIALYLGSFNPFHNGHLEVVETALNDFKMDKVIIVPTMQNPWKEEKVLDIDERLYIIGRTIIVNTEYMDDDENPDVELSDIEKELIPPYYSYATLHALKNKYCNDEIFVLCGEDTIKDIPNWMNGGEIIKDYNFLIVDRPQNTISSTIIRNKVKNGEDISQYVNKNVVNLIKKYYE
jgi:nicotinate-nucleotide adenylyltransferase